MALFRVSNNRAQFDAAGNEASDQYGAGIRFTQGGNARVTTSSATNYNQGIPMSSTGQVAIVDATAGLPAGTIFHNGLPISADKVCVSRNATAVVSNGLPYDAAGAVAADINFDLNFVENGTLNPSVTFTRASTATYFNSAGVLTSAAINESRRDFDPATLAVRGLLIEEQRTNVLTYSAQFDNPVWSLIRSTVSPNVIASPDGNVNADKLIEDTTPSASHIIARSDPVSSGATVTISVYAKAAERSWIVVYEATSAVGRFFNLATGVVGSIFTGTPTASNIQSVGNGWYRCSITTTVPLTTVTTRFYPALSDNVVSYTGDGTSGLFIWGAQTEAGAFPTSYIPTTTTALTRSADVASVNTLSPWYNQSEGTLFADVQAAAGFNVAGLFGRYAAIQDALNNNSVEMFFDGPVAGAPRYRVRSGGVNQAVGSSATGYTANTTLKASLAYKVNDFAGVSRGVVDLTDTSGVVPVGPTVLSLGSEGGTINYLNGWLRRVTYYPRRLSNAELQAITA